MWLWAFAVVLDQAKWRRFQDGPLEWALMLLALATLLWPGSRRLFAGLVTLSLITVWPDMPWLSNHRTLAALAGMTILGSGLWAVGRARAVGRAAAGDWLDTFVPLLRWETVLLYGFAAWHKLNADWFDPAVSCGAFLYVELLQGWPDLLTGPLGQRFAIYGALAVEALIPVFLLIPRLRAAGIIVGVTFHLILGLGSFFNFSGYMAALLFLFLPRDAGARLLAWADEIDPGRVGRRGLRRVVGSARAVAAVVLPVALVLGLAIAPWTPRLRWSLAARNLYLGPWTPAYYAVLLGWFVVTVGVAVGLAAALRARPVHWGNIAQTFRPAHPLLLLFPLLVFLNGVSPYLGFKTEGVFSMFSNLATERGVTNHLILPRPLQLASYQVDLVQAIASSDDELQLLADQGRALPALELRRYLADRRERGVTGTRLTYERNGTMRTVADAENDPELGRAPSYLERKLLRFRAAPPPGITPCTH